MGYRLGCTLNHWMDQAHHRAPLGHKAVEDGIREIADYYRIEVLQVEFTPKPDHYLIVSIRHRDQQEPPSERTQWTAFTVRNPGITGPWEAMLRFIKQRQEEMPLHLRGKPHNADEETTRFALDQVRTKTGYEGLALGDLWVHVQEGMLSFGELTRAGEIAMHKYIDLLRQDGAVAEYPRS